MQSSDQDAGDGKTEDVTKRNVDTIADLEKAVQTQTSRADRIADRIGRFCGSMKFVWVHVAIFAIWIGGNTLAPDKRFDEYPFDLLALIVSLEAIFLTTFIIISENRKARIDERRSNLDLQINLLAEQENTKMFELLEKIAEKLGIEETPDPDAKAFSESTNPGSLLSQIDESLEKAEKEEEE